MFATVRRTMSSAGGGGGGKKRYKRIRAHVNPLSILSYDYPNTPAEAKWDKYYPTYFEHVEKSDNPDAFDKQVRIADVGCGFGGLLEALSKPYPDKLSLGMEIREPVVKSVQRRIAKLQTDNPAGEDETGIPPYSNIGVVHTNVMKYLVRFFHKGQLEKMFFCFPDPHFKKSKHRRRIITTQLLSEYAYVLREGGMIYTITDVLDLHNWMVKHLESHPLFDRVSDAELEGDPSVDAMYQTDESHKVTRLGGSKYVAVFRRLPNPE
jgi:tRNA (guanine-N7-)-methyltransferase